MKKRRIISLTILIVILFSIVSCIAMIGKNMEKEVAAIDETEAVSLSFVNDGTYEGKAETTLVKAEVSVRVENHKIVSIDILRHDNGKGENAEKIVGEMVKENTSEVDIITGATASSKVIRAAVRNALQKGI